MQKKVLIPVLMAVPVALPAMADIDMGFPLDNWKQGGTTGDENSVNPDNNGFTCVVGTDYLGQQLNYPKGKYKLIFGEQTNVKVLVGSKDNLTPVALTHIATSSEWEGEFEITGDNGVYIKITGEDPSMGFNFIGKQILLVFDQSAVVNPLKAQLEGLKATALNDVVAEDDFQEAVDLRAEKENITAALASYEGTPFETIWAEIGSIGGTASKDDCIAIYRKYGLYNDPSDIAQYLDSLSVQINTYNENVVTENATWQVYLDNVAARENLLTEQTTLATNIDQVKQAITNWPVFDEQIKSGIKGEADALSTKIDEYATAINTAYPLESNRVALRTEIVFDSQATVLQAEIDALNIKLSNLKQNYDTYYDVNYVQLAKLEKAKKTYCEAVTLAQGISGYETVYDVLKETNKVEAEEYYKSIKDNNTIPNVESANTYNEEHKCKENIESAISKFDADTKAFNKMVETQNANMTTALEQLGQFDESIAPFEKMTVPEQFKAEFNEKLETIKSEVEALRGYVDSEYRNHSLTVESTSDYGTKVANIQSLIDELNAFTQPFAIVNDLQAALDKAKVDIKTISDNTTAALKDGGEVDIYSKFEGNFDAFEGAINDLSAEEANDSTVTGEIKKRIENSVTNAQSLSDYFIYAHGVIFGEYQVALNNLVTFVNDKKIDEIEQVKNLKEYFKAKYTNDGGQFPKAIADLKAVYTEAAGAETQKAYDLIEGLCEDTLKEKPLIAEMDSVKVEFAGKATDANLEYAVKKVDGLEAALNTAISNNITNIENVDLGPIQKELGTIQTNVSVAKGAEDPATELGIQDDEIVALLEKIDGVNKQITDLTANQEAYDALVKDLNSLQEQLKAVSAYNDANSIEPGKAYYKNTVIPAIQAKIDNLKDTDLPTSLEAESVIADRDKEGGYKAQITLLGEEISNTRTAIEKNNTAHNNQLAREKEVRTYIENLIKEIESNENAKDLPDVKTWLEELRSLINNDLNDVNIKVTESYGDGKSDSENETIMALYQAIYDKANGIDVNYHGDAFHNAVVNANSQTTASWEQTLEELWDQYKGGIGTYNIFYYDLTNPGWREFVIGTVERHATLFDFYNIINTLKEEEAAAVAKWNEENHVITAEEWQEWLDKAAAVSSDITADVNNLLAETDALAETYYGELEAKAAGAISEAETLLNNAGISLDNLAEARLNYGQAVALYNGVNEHVSYKMDEIAGYLDKVFESIDLQGYAESAWADKYSDAQNEIVKLRDEINGYQNAQPEVKEAALNAFADTVETIVKLNDEVTSVKENLINDYKTYADSLEELLNVLRGYRDEVKKSNDLNVEDQQLQNNFNTVWLPGMNDAYEALREYCETLSGANMETKLSEIRNRIDVISEQVIQNGGRLVELNLEDRYNEVIGEINDAYRVAFRNEVTYLRQLVKDTKVAFNDAVKYEGQLPEGKTFDSVDLEISELNSKIEELHYNAENKDALHDEALGYENALCSLYAMLQSCWGDNENPATAILNALNSRYDTIAQAIATGEEYLSGCMESVKTEFAGKYGELKEALDAEHNDWSDDGDHIIARESYYTNALNQIEVEVNALTENVKLAEEAAQAEAEKQRVSNERYEVLKAEYDDINKQFEDAKALVESYGNGIAEMYSITADYIEEQLAKMLEKLESDKAGYLLTADSELENADGLLDLINVYKLSATREYAGVVLGATGEAAYDASYKLRTLDIVPAQRKILEEQYKEANYEYQDLLVEKNNADFDRLNEIIARAEELAETFKTISENATANSFIPGDVDLDENGEVNVLDIQMLINMIGEGVTYQQLYDESPRQACAADVTGNENLNVADVTALIQIVLGDDFNVVKVRAHKPAAKVDGGLTLALVEEGDGVRRYALMLNGGVPFTGGQFDIHVSGTAQIIAADKAERTAGHDAYLFDRGLGDYRVVLASMQNSVFAGAEGTIVYIDVEGEGELTVENALFSDTNNIEHELGRAHTSAVDAIIDYCKDGAKRIYDAAGRTFNSLQRGINIIINKDGSVKKELRK